MNAATTITIYQCSKCERQHDDHGGLVAFRPCIPEITDCLLEDCGDVAAANAKRLQDERQRHLANKIARRQRSGARTGHQAKPGPHCRAKPAQHGAPLPYADPDAAERLTESQIQGELSPAGTVAVFEFLSHPARLGKYVANYMIQAAGGGKCSRLNSVMDRLRSRLKAEGKYELSEALHVEGERRELHYYKLTALSASQLKK